MSTAGYLLCFREATSEVDRNPVVFAMLFSAAVLNSLTALARARRPTKPSGQWWMSVVVLAVFTVSGNVAVAAAVEHLGPGVTSTVMQTQVFFVAIGAWFFLKEPFGRALMLGATCAALGFGLFSFPGFDAASLSPVGLLWGIGTSLSFAAMLVWTRWVIKNLDPVPLNAARLWLSVAAMALWPGIASDAFHMPTRAWIFAALAAFGCPFAGRLCVMYALRFITAAETKLWTMLSAVFAFLFVFLVYGEVPNGRELGGATLVLMGVLLPNYKVLLRSRIHQKKPE